MHRYTPLRNHRSQGIKIKHVLRICFLVAACCWLIFQIKRSHYKRKYVESVDTKILSSTDSVGEVVKLGRKDLQPKEKTREEEDDEVDENEQYKFYDEDSESQTANEAREQHYKADDASSEVTLEHEDQTLDYIKFLEISNISSDHSQYEFESTRVVGESETFLKSSNMSTVVEPQTILTTEENNSGSLKRVVETEEPDEVQHDTIDSTDSARLQDLDVLHDGQDTVAE